MVWRSVLDVAAFMLVFTGVALLLWGVWLARCLDEKIERLGAGETLGRLQECIRAEVERSTRAGVSVLVRRQAQAMEAIGERLEMMERALLEAVPAASLPRSSQPELPPSSSEPTQPPPGAGTPTSLLPPSGRGPTMWLRPGHVPPAAVLPFKPPPSPLRRGVGGTTGDREP